MGERTSASCCVAQWINHWALAYPRYPRYPRQPRQPPRHFYIWVISGERFKGDRASWIRLYVLPFSQRKGYGNSRIGIDLPMRL